MRLFQSCSAGRSKDNKSRPVLLMRPRIGAGGDACMCECGLYSKMEHHYFFVLDGGQRTFRGNEHEPNCTHFDGCRLSAEPWLLCSFLEHGARAHWAAGNSVPGAGVGGTLFRASGAIAGLAHCPVSRSIWIDVVVRLAAGADVPGTGDVSPTAFRGSVRSAVHPCFLS